MMYEKTRDSHYCYIMDQSILFSSGFYLHYFRQRNYPEQSRGFNGVLVWEEGEGSSMFSNRNLPLRQLRVLKKDKLPLFNI